MSTRKLGFGITGLGLLGALFSLVVDLLGLGRPGIQAAQLAGLQIGIIMAAIGVGFVLKEPPDEIDFKGLAASLLKRALNLPNLSWILAGFLIVYVGLFVMPVFWNATHRIQYFNRYIPDLAPIGADLTWNALGIRSWLAGQSLDTGGGHSYPPLYAVIFAPIVLLPYPADFQLMTIVTLLSTLLLFLGVRAMVRQGGSPAISVFFLLTLLFSYGMQFELERGQFNLLTLALCVSAVYLFHFRPSFRHLAYLLFTMAVQIKVYPAIFVLMLVDDWRDWRGNAKRVIGLGLVNVSLLFALGIPVFTKFLHSVSALGGQSWGLAYNSSARGFAHFLARTGPELFRPQLAAWLTEHVALVEALLLASYFVCLIAVVARAVTRQVRGMNPDLFLVCAVGAMVVPSISSDYKLTLLAVPLAMCLGGRSSRPGYHRRIVENLLLLLISIAYSITLFPFGERPTILANSLPLLLVIVAAVTALNFLNSGGIESAEAGAS